MIVSLPHKNDKRCLILTGLFNYWAAFFILNFNERYFNSWMHEHNVPKTKTSLSAPWNEVFILL